MFSINLAWIYDNLANEYGEPMEDYIPFTSFIKMLQEGKLEMHIEESPVGYYLVFRMNDHEPTE